MRYQTSGRYKFALAAYNAGRANINRCLEYARQATGAPGSFQEWVDAGKAAGSLAGMAGC
jgi:membrane-bound lytic murein transglycosylase MltF